MRLRFAAAAALALLAGCGGGGAETPSQTLSKTADNLGKIHSGVMAVDVSAKGSGGGAKADVGYKLAGPFALGDGGKLPVARLQYTQRSGGQQATATFISTGSEAFVETGGKARRLPDAQANQLRAAAGTVSSNGGVKKLRLDSWMRDPKRSAGPPVGGDKTDRITARVLVAKALADLGAPLDARGAKDVERAVKDARVEVLTGADDRLLRRLTLDLTLGLNVPAGLKAQLGKLVGGKIRLAFEISHPNRKVQVAAPAGATTG